MNRQTIIYVGDFSFPNGGAAARRILGNAMAIQEAGYKIIVGSGQMHVNNSVNLLNYKEIEVYSLKERVADHLPRIMKDLIYLRMGKRTIEWLGHLPQKPAAIILYSGYSPYLLRLLPWCRKNKIPLIVDHPEWYEASCKLIMFFSMYYWNIELAMRLLSVRAGNIISISSYLDLYYRSKSCKSLMIPPTLDTLEIFPSPNFIFGRSIKLAYTGTPGSKDLLNNILEAVVCLDSQGQRFILSLAGVQKDDLLQYPALAKRGYTTLPQCIRTKGIVPHSEAIDIVKESDFSVLLRKQNRVSIAGFPTKVVESMAVGTPVICNLTGDLSNYIHDGIEGVVCNGYRVEDLQFALERAHRLTKRERIEMRENARRQAKKSFDYRNYITSFQEFLNTTITENKKESNNV